MDNAELKQKLHHYIETAEEKKLQALFTMVEDEIKTNYTHWDDDDFVAELHEREAAYLSGSTNTYSLEETLNHAKEAIKQKGK